MTELSVRHQKVKYPYSILPINMFLEEVNHPREGRWHNHKEAEILVVLKGEITIWIDQSRYCLKAGDTLLIGSSQLHRGKVSGNLPLSYIVLHLDLGAFIDPVMMTYGPFLLEIHRPLSDINELWNNDERFKEQFIQCILNMFQEWEEKAEGFQIAVSLHVKQLLLFLIRNYAHGQNLAAHTTHIERLKPAMEYVESHLHEKITVQRASQLVNMSYYHFCKYFKEAMGIPFIDYVTVKRVKKAELLLLTEDLPVSRIGEEIGLPNASHFYDIFRRYHQCSPLQFRKKYEIQYKSFTKVTLENPSLK